MSIKILYVDDEEVNLFLFRHTVGLHFEVLTAISGAEALKVLHEHPDIKAVVSDMRMPEMDGVTFIEEARKDFPDVCYFILTGYSFNERVTEAQEKGIIVGSFVKPYEVDVLKQAIEGCL